MKNRTSILKRLGRVAVVTGLALGFVGCTENASFAPQNATTAIETTAGGSKLIQTNAGQVKLLKADPAKHPSIAELTLGKGLVDSSIHAIEEFATVSGGGVLEVGEVETGLSRVILSPNDLPHDMTVAFEWAASSSYSGMVVSDDSVTVVLNSPMELQLSYHWAELYDVDEDSIALYFYDPVADEWQYVGGSVNTNQDMVTVSVDQFGQFALFEQRDGDIWELVRRDPDVFFKERHIKARRGGRVVVGNRDVGISFLRFRKNALPEDLDIEFQWAASGTFEGMFSKLDFGPHGTYFNKPVKMVLSYKTADLTGVNEDSLKVYYYNEDTGIWELIGGTVNKRKKQVVCWLEHFSRYALGGE